MNSNGISEAASENTKTDWRAMLDDLDDEKLLVIAARGNPEPAIAARAILEERDRATKPKRGRPAVMNRAERAMYEGMRGDTKTARSLQNTHYRIRALASLKDDDRFKWLFDKESGAWKPGILAELGRVEDYEEMRAYAEAICKAKPKTKDAITRLRRARLDKSPQGDALTLANRLIRTINEYLTTHPDTGREDILAAIRTAQDSVERSLQR